MDFHDSSHFRMTTFSRLISVMILLAVPSFDPALPALPLVRQPANRINELRIKFLDISFVHSISNQIFNFAPPYRSELIYGSTTGMYGITERHEVDLRRVGSHSRDNSRCSILIMICADWFKIDAFLINIINRMKYRCRFYGSTDSVDFK